MEETVQSLLQYKSRVDTLKQEKASLSTALERSPALSPIAGGAALKALKRRPMAVTAPDKINSPAHPE
ncbi:hypothetical protein EVAR_63007_1 [Eumeta japonica]|uniref:Uncharacterized protein n=1 Tax=Eumeta variegata TaxID=151549 RepID=A0A4C1YXD4_EUMVA|nr:hypothetical protein EVAR_63007_1 [Eumeta japonica]